MSWQLQPLAAAHLPGLAAVQQVCYGAALVEPTAVFAQRLHSPANASWAVVTRAQPTQVLAYLAAYQSQRGKVTPLHGDFAPVATPDTLYLHDMAVLPQHHGQGLARALLAQLLHSARQRGLRHSALVSVQDSQAYWQRQGYAVHALDCATQRQHLASYGVDALYMLRNI